MVKYEVTECKRGDFHFGPDSYLLWLRLLLLGILLTVWGQQSQEFVLLQATFKTEMAAVKSIVNKINMNHTRQCYRIRNQEEEIGANMASYFRGTSHKCVPTAVALSRKQV